MREQQAHTFSTHDGVELFYRHWPATSPADGEPRQAIVLFHRGHEHSGRIAHLVDELNLPSSTSSPGTPAATANPPASAVTAPASPPAPATCKPFVTISAPPTASKRKTSLSSPKASVR